jgi:hypothetical protein
MVRKRYLWIPLALLVTLLAGAAWAGEKPKPKKEDGTKEEAPIKWVFVNYRLFQMEHLVGNLSSCVYRATQPGDKLVSQEGDRVQVTAIRKGEEIDIQVRVNDAHLPTFSPQMMEKGLEHAINDCFSKLTE